MKVDGGDLRCVGWSMVMGGAAMVVGSGSGSSSGVGDGGAALFICRG